MGSCCREPWTRQLLASVARAGRAGSWVVYCTKTNRKYAYKLPSDIYSSVKPNISLQMFPSHISTRLSLAKRHVMLAAALHSSPASTAARPPAGLASGQLTPRCFVARRQRRPGAAHRRARVRGCSQDGSRRIDTTSCFGRVKPSHNAWSVSAGIRQGRTLFAV